MTSSESNVTTRDVPSGHEVTVPDPNEVPGRSYLEKAFNYYFLIPMPFVLVSLVLAVWNALTYIWDSGPWLCYVYLRWACKIFQPFLLTLVLYPIFVVLALSIPDYLLSLSPVFQRPGASAMPSSAPHSGQGDSLNTDNDHPSSIDPPVWGEGKEQRAGTILWLLMIAGATFATLWGLASIAAIAEASFILRNDHPFTDPDGKYKERVFLGYAEAVFDALLALFMVRAASLCSYARDALGGNTQGDTGLTAEASLKVRISRALQTIPPRILKLHCLRLAEAVRTLSFTQVRDRWYRLWDWTRGLPIVIGQVDWRRMGGGIWNARQALSIAKWKGYWHRPTAFDRCLAYLLFSFGVAIVSFMTFLPRCVVPSDQRLYPGFIYGGLTFLTLAFAYIFLLTYHSYRSAGVQPGAITSLLTSVVACILLTLWVLHSLASLASVVYSFFCDHVSRRPLGPILCTGPSAREIFFGVLGAPTAALQIYALGGVVVASWKAKAGVYLEADLEDRTGLPPGTPGSP